MTDADITLLVLCLVIVVGAMLSGLVDRSEAMDTSDILDTLKGCVDGLQKVMQATGMEVDEIEELALNNNVEICPECGWWCDSFDLVPTDADEPDGYCNNCRLPTIDD